MKNSVLKTTYLRDDQDCSASENLQSFFLALMPDETFVLQSLQSYSSNSRQIHRSFSFEKLRFDIMGEFYAYLRYLSKTHRDVIISLSSAFHSALKDLHSLEEYQLFQEVAKVSFNFFKLKCGEMNQQCIQEFLKEIKIVQQDLKKRNLLSLNSLIIGIIHQIKNLGKIIFYYSLINEDPFTDDMDEFTCKTKPQVFSRRETKSITFMTEQFRKANQSKINRWSLEYKNKRKTQQKIEKAMICKICLNKVFSNLLDAHSEHCLKRAESLKELNSLLKTTNEFLVTISEIKQFLITKAKLDLKLMKRLKYSQRKQNTMGSLSPAMKNSEYNRSSLFKFHLQNSSSLLAISPLHSEKFRKIKQNLNFESEIELEKKFGKFENLKSVHHPNAAILKRSTTFEQKFHNKVKTCPLNKPNIQEEHLVDLNGKQKELNYNAEKMLLINYCENDCSHNTSICESIMKNDSTSEFPIPKIPFSTNTPKEHTTTLLELEGGVSSEVTADNKLNINEENQDLAVVETFSVEKSSQEGENNIIGDKNRTKFEMNSIQETIRKKEKAIRNCILLQRHLRHVIATEFSMFSIRTLEVCLELWNDVVSVIQLSNQEKGYENDKALEIQEVLNKIAKVGTKFLKYNKLSCSYRIHKKSSKSKKQSSIFSQEMTSALVRMDRWHCFKLDKISPQEQIRKQNFSFGTDNLSNIQLISSDDNNSIMTLNGDENPHSLYIDNNQLENILYRNKQNGQKEERCLMEKEAEIKAHDFRRKSRFGIFLEDEITLKKNRTMSTLHSLDNMSKERTVAGANKMIGSCITQNDQKNKKINSLLNFVKEAQTPKRKFSLEPPQKKNKENEEKQLTSKCLQKEEYDERIESIKIKDSISTQNRHRRENYLDSNDEEDKPFVEEERLQESIYLMNNFYSDSDMPKNIAESQHQKEDKHKISIHDFEIFNLIGKGAYGRVYLVRRKRTEDLYAMKVINTLDNMNKNQMASLQTESEILDLVTSEYVVKAIFKFKHDIFFCFVMEYMYGGDFNHILQTYGRFDENVARFYIAELVLAVEHLHNVGVVHRDLKPDNILLDSKGHIKLTDFGLSGKAITNLTNNKKSPIHSTSWREEKFHQFISKMNINEKKLNLPREYRFQGSNPIIYPRDSIINSLSKEMISKPSLINSKKSQHRIVGTPDYIAPEIICGIADSLNNPAIDWWSLGVILFEFLIGIPPFSDDTVDKIFDNIKNLRVPWEEIAVNENEEESSEDKISKVALDLMKKLLVSDPKARLDLQGIKHHPFFKGINWNTLSQSQPPIVPEPMQRNLTSSIKDYSFLEVFINAGNLSNRPQIIDQCLEENIRFDLLHKENQKNAQETLLKLKKCEGSPSSLYSEIK